jgi:hypothetical protein
MLIIGDFHSAQIASALIDSLRGLPRIFATERLT